MHEMRGALRAGAVAAGLSAATTLLLWLLPRLSIAPVGLEPEIALAADPFHLARLGVNFGHVFLALAGYAAATVLVARRSPAFAWAGLVAFGIWALAEAIGVSINLWAVNMTWRAGYAAADPAGQAAIKAAILTVAGIWDGLFFLVLVSFLAGSLLLGLGAIATPGTARAIPVLLLLGAALTLVILLDGYFGAQLSPLIGWAYPLLQPISRAAMAVWIWREASNFRLGSFEESI